MTNFSLFGFGPWALNYVRALSTMKDVNLKSILRLHPEKTKDNISDSYLVTSNIDKALDGVDAVIIASHPSSHKELSLQCLKRKLPVILEKPVALNFDDAYVILNSFEEKNVPILVNNIHLFSTAFETLKRDVHIWNPVHIYSEAGSQSPVRDYSSLLDWGPHDVSMALSILGGSPESVEINKTSNEYGDIFTIKLSLKESIAELKVGNGFSSKKRYFTVEHNGRSVVYDDMAIDKYVVDGRKVKIPHSDSLKRMILTFLNCINYDIKDWRFSTKFNLDVMNAITMD